MAQPKKRSRAVSLSLDWDNIVKEEHDTMIAMGGKCFLQGAIEYERPLTEFCTGSTYTGKWNALGMTHSGLYVFPYGVEYEGGIADGMFHGEGTLSYPMGQKLECVWDKGKMLSYKFANVDGLEMDESWGYCKMPDRRFTVSIREDLQPAPNEFKTNQQPTREIEEGCYDTGDGFYDPTSRTILRVRDPAEYESIDPEDVNKYSAEDDFWINYVSIVNDEEDVWIRKHCRKAWDEPAGYRPEFYEHWITGRADELAELNEFYISKSIRSIHSEKATQDAESVAEEQPDLSDNFSYAGTGRKLFGASLSL